MSETVQGNAPEARTETGEIVNQVSTTPPETKPAAETETQVEAKPAEAAKPADSGSLLNQDEEKPAESGAPEAYTDFTAPEGMTLDKDLIAQATPLLKELGLSQDQAQKLVDFQTKINADISTKAYKDYVATREGWQKEVKADPEIGSKLNDVRTTIGRALDGLGDPALAKGFRDAMDLTGAGDHPAFVKAFYKLAQQVTEGKSVTGNGPSKEAQKSPGAAPPSLASALYPKLPSSAAPPQ